MPGTGIDDVEDAAGLIGDLTDRLEDLQVSDLDGEASAGPDGGPVALTDVFTRPFVRRHTDAPTFAAFVEASPLADHDGAPGGDLDAYVAAHSEFDSWAEMEAAAKVAWMERELGLL